MSMGTEETAITPRAHPGRRRAVRVASRAARARRLHGRPRARARGESGRRPARRVRPARTGLPRGDGLRDPLLTRVDVADSAAVAVRNAILPALLVLTAAVAAGAEAGARLGDPRLCPC